MLDKLASILTGGLADTVMSGIKAYFPPDMSDEQKASVSLELQRIELEKQASVNKAVADAEKSINERIAISEGTAKDLMALPIVGRLLIFARGAQRPVWGFSTMYADYMWFSGQWSGLTQQQESSLWVINLLVLGFLFGERAVQNVAPLIAQHFVKK
ncbi:hypothetical protein NVP1104O_54 [Vibrio phage 1.104.O._10N.286.49.A12]|nr:hypothetical protein NVP1104O_54 [Vibrio phage 1.104.O._10N.286.49.A12]